MDTEMLHVLSARLRSQSLEEITTLGDSSKEDKDSGTESDNEELTSITQGMPTLPSSSPSASQRSEVIGACPVPVASSCPPVPTFHITPPLPMGLSEGYDDDDDDEHLDYDVAGSSSAECSVDYDHAFPRPPVLLSVAGGTQQSPPMLTAFPSMDKISDCDSELANLLQDVHTPPNEDDDRSPVNRCGSCGSLSAESEEEDDDEVSATFERKSPGPLRFRSSPPKGVHRLNKRTISPKVFLASTGASRFHRHHRFTGLTQRPHLDFEKMQVTRNTRILYSVM